MEGQSVASLNPFMYLVNDFPPIVDGRMNAKQYIAAAADLIIIVEKFGALLLPVKNDMAHNLHKIRSHFTVDENSCLIELMLKETAKGRNTGTGGVLWFNRASKFFELTFEQIVYYLNTKISIDKVNMKKILKIAYENSVKTYHSWFTRQLFYFSCRQSPSLRTILHSFQVKDIDDFEILLEKYKYSLHENRRALDEFFAKHNIS